MKMLHIISHLVISHQYSVDSRVAATDNLELATGNVATERSV